MQWRPDREKVMTLTIEEILGLSHDEKLTENILLCNRFVKNILRNVCGSARGYLAEDFHEVQSAHTRASYG